MPLSRLSGVSAARGIAARTAAARTAAARTSARTAAARTSARGGIGALTAARGGSGALTAARVGSGALTAARGGSGAGRGFASFEENEKGKKGTLKICALLGGFTSVCGCVSYGYWKMARHIEAKSKAYVDARLVEFKSFPNVATGTHHEPLHKFSEAIDELRSKVVAMEQKEFVHRKELVIAAEILHKHQMELAAAAAAAAK